MSDKSRISWTDATWNVVVGCTRVSSGCAACYAIRSTWRMAGNPNPKVSEAYAGLVERQPNGRLDWTGEVRCLPERLHLPLRWKKPRRIFVNALSDLFHERVPDAFLIDIFGVMALAEQHTFQVLTKRPARMAEFMKKYQPSLRNVWLGVSCENQVAADERIPILLQMRANIRFVSLEPLLGPIDLTSLNDGWSFDGSWSHWDEETGDICTHWEHTGIDWVIVGGESSGPERRCLVEKCTHPGCAPSVYCYCGTCGGTGWRPKAWALLAAGAIRRDCQLATIPFYFKQWGGKRAGGPALLDGREWREFPQVVQYSGRRGDHGTSNGCSLRLKTL